MLNRSPVFSARAPASSIELERGVEVLHLRAVDRERCERSHTRPPVVVLGDLEGAPPHLLRPVEVPARPRHPAGEQQGPGERHGLAELLGRGEGPVEQLLRLVEIGLDVDRDVSEEPQRERHRERVLVLRRDRRRALEGVARLRVLAEPVARLAHAGEGPRLAHAPPVLGSRHRERPPVVVDGRAALHPATRAVGRAEQGVGRALGECAVLRVHVQRGERRELEVVGGVRGVPRGEQAIGDPLVQSQPLALRQARVGHFAQRWRGGRASAPAPRCRLRGRGSRPPRGRGAHRDRPPRPRHRARAGRRSRGTPMRGARDRATGARARRGAPPPLPARWPGRARTGWMLTVAPEQHAGGLHDEERVAPGASGDLGGLLVGDAATAGLAHERDRVVGGQRLEPQHHRVGRGGAPRGVLLDELRAREGERERRARPARGGVPRRCTSSTMAGFSACASSNTSTAAPSCTSPSTRSMNPAWTSCTKADSSIRCFAAPNSSPSRSTIGRPPRGRTSVRRAHVSRCRAFSGASPSSIAREFGDDGRDGCERGGVGIGPRCAAQDPDIDVEAGDELVGEARLADAALAEDRGEDRATGRPRPERSTRAGS